MGLLLDQLIPRSLMQDDQEGQVHGNDERPWPKWVPSSIRHSAEKTCRVTATGSKKSEKEGRPLERITVRGFENGRSQREDAYQFYGLSI